MSPFLQGRFLTGSAGTGKTFTYQERMRNGDEGIRLCATTGIAAVNLGAGVTTIHSLLGFFDDKSLADRFYTGRLTHKFYTLLAEEGMRELVLDEVSMFSADALEIIWKAFEEASERWKTHAGLEWIKPTLVLLGDACQLPPVGDKVRWFHEADIWQEEFAPNTTRLTKIWRQSNPTFLAALAAARTGNGPEAARLLQSCGVEFSNQVDATFPGSTLVGTNEKMNRYNFLRLKQVEGPTFAMKSSRWTVPGQNPPAEWEHIPEVDYLRPGALVMIKANDIPGWRYANGDLATVIGWDKDALAWKLQLKRSGEEVFIGRITRQIESRDVPPWITTDRRALSPEEGREKKIPFRNSTTRAWVLGEIEYFPLKLAYSTTTHSSQGLTLDAVQIDVREAFMGSPATCYVALSRCRTPEGLRIVGTPELLGKRIKIHEKAKGWA